MQLCARRQVCDSVSTGNNLKTGYCHCAPHHCWNYKLAACVPENMEAQEFVQQLVNKSVIQQPLQKARSQAKGVLTILTSVKDGVKNLKAIIGHVMAIGPGLMITAWTVKLIFAHSYIPAYFCYMFPFLYCPFAWSIYNIICQVLPDWRLYVGFVWLSFWPMLMAALGWWYGLHREMSVPRMMGVINNLLVIYYGNLFAAYCVLAAFVIFYSPEGGDLDGIIGNPRDLAVMAVAKMPAKAIIIWLLDSFGMFFYTCCAATDAFIVLICSEHQEAWLMHHKSKLRSADGGGAPGREGIATAVRKRVETMAPSPQDDPRFGVEEDVIKDWLHLINPNAEPAKPFSEEVAEVEGSFTGPDNQD